MKKQTVLVLVIVLALIIAAAYFLRRPVPVSVSTTTPPPATSTAVAYSCQQGTINAVYGPNSVSLALSDGRTFKLAQAVSGSGARYASGDGSTVFWNKGNNAFLQEGSATTFDDCVGGTTVVSGTTATFTDGTKLFSFDYPAQFTLYGSEGDYDTTWKQMTQDSGLLLAVVDIPKTFQPQTNFVEAKFTVGTSSDPDAVANCLTEQDAGPDSTTSAVIINGVTFTKITFSGAGAGQIYDTTSYRVLHNSQCYAVEYTIHSSNLGNYSPDQHISAFDQTQVQGTLESMVQSFRFLQ